MVEVVVVEVMHPQPPPLRQNPLQGQLLLPHLQQRQQQGQRPLLLLLVLPRVLFQWKRLQLECLRELLMHL